MLKNVKEQYTLNFMILTINTLYKKIEKVKLLQIFYMLENFTHFVVYQTLL